MNEDRNDPTAAERMARYRARQAGQDVPLRRPGPKPTPAEIEQFRQALRAAWAAGEGDWAARFAPVQAEVDREFERKRRAWERSAPQRQAAQQAMDRANRQREAENGTRRRVPVAAALDWMRPERPQVG